MDSRKSFDTMATCLLDIVIKIFCKPWLLESLMHASKSFDNPLSKSKVVATLSTRYSERAKHLLLILVYSHT